MSHALGSLNTLNYMGQSQGYRRGQTDVATASPMNPMSMLRRSSASPLSAANRMDGMPIREMGSPDYAPQRHNSWLGSRGRSYSSNDDFSRPLNIPAFKGAYAPLPRASAKDPYVLVRPGGGDLAESAPSDIAVKSSSPGAGSTDPQIPLEKVVKDYIVGRWAAYVNSGWDLFRSRKYLQAFDMFKLADSMTLDDPKQAVDVKVAELIAGVAAGQYAAAATALGWLLADDTKTGQTRCPDLLDRLLAIESYYGNKQDFQDHLQSIEHVVMSKDTSADLQALRAVMLWGKKDRVKAVFYAKSLGESGIPAPWPKLFEMMTAANRSLPNQNRPTTAPAVAGLSQAPGL